jgi:hypothetical protein
MNAMMWLFVPNPMQPAAVLGEKAADDRYYDS